MKTLDKTLDFNHNSIEEKYIKHGVLYAGKLLFGGFVFNVFVVSTKYTDENKQTQSYFPEDSALVTSPNCGHMMYMVAALDEYFLTMTTRAMSMTISTCRRRIP